MASNTNRYGLQRLAANDALSLNGYEYSTTDRDAIDRLISVGAELHHHTGIAQPNITPVAPPGLTLDNTTGALSAGIRYYYVFTLVDVFGNESASSPESFYDIPPPVASPGSPTLTYVPTSGTLPPGNYYYQLTAFTSNNGLETLAGGASYISVAVTASTNAVIITLPALPVGATGFNIYRRSPNGNTYNYLTTINTGATPTWTDFGTITPNLLRTLPASNTTLSTNSITVSYPGTTPIVPAGYSWKIYRSVTSGSYISALVAWITGGATPPATTYKDRGLATAYGQPPEASQVVGTPPKVLLTSGAEVQGVLPIANGGTGSPSATFVPQWKVVSKAVDYAVGPGEMVIVGANSINLTLPANPPIGTSVAVVEGVGVSTFNVLPNTGQQINRWTPGTIASFGTDFSQNGSAVYTYTAANQWTVMATAGTDAGMCFTVFRDFVSDSFAQFKGGFQLEGWAFPVANYTVPGVRGSAVSRIACNGTFTVTFDGSAEYVGAVGIGVQWAVMNIGAGTITVAGTGGSTIVGPTVINPGASVVYEIQSEVAGVSVQLRAVASYGLVNPWIAPALLNSYANVGGGYTPAGYRLDPDGAHVELAGAVTGGIGGNAIFQLPAGYRPTTIKSPLVSAINAAARNLIVDTGGVVQANDALGAGTFLCFDGIKIPIDR